jgi:Tol biopolymer transport system component
MSISPDGDLVATIGRGGNLSLVDSGTGDQRNITNSRFPQLVMGAEFSNSGDRIAYVWHNGDDFDDLRIVRVDGSGDRVVYRNPDVRSIWVKDWSPFDRDVLALLLGYDGTLQIVAVPVSGDSAVVISRVEPASQEIPGRMLYSPDGNHIAYDVAARSGPLPHDIFYMAADGSESRKLVGHPADDRLVGWSPDGNSIVFASDGSGTVDLWEIGITDVASQPKPRLLRSEIGQHVPLRLTPEGAFYHGIVTCDCNVYTADLNDETGFLEDTPRALAAAFHNSGVDWSADGTRIAYIAPAGGVVPASAGIVRAAWALVVWDPQSGEEQRFYPEIDRLHQLRPLWSPQGDVILLKGWDRNAYPRVSAYAIDANSGNARLVHDVQSLWRGGFDWIGWADKGQAISYVDTRADMSAGIVVQDLDSKTTDELYRENTPPYVYGLSASPDGANLAFGLWNTSDRTSSLAVLNSETGDRRMLLETTLPKQISTPAWYPDSRHIMYESDGKLWRIAMAGGEPITLGSYAPLSYNQAGISIHPDGDRVAFVAEEERRSEIRVVPIFRTGDR